MNKTAVRLVVAIVTGVSCHSSAFAQARGDAEHAPRILLTATLDLLRPPFAGAVERISADGELHIGPYEGKPGKEPPPPNGPLAEGLYLGVVRGSWKDLRDAQLVRVDVTEVRGDGMVVAKVGRGLDGTIPVGKLILLVRPARSTTEQMRALPDLVTLEPGPLPQAATPETTPDTQAATAKAERADLAERHLAAIAKAIIGYDKANGCFPPAALIGPDGKPWHSWRVLILRFSDDPALREVFGRYSLDEPWDGPRNRQLLETMPAVYGDEPGGKPADGCTRFAAVTGPGTMFSPDGVPFDPTAKPVRFGHGTIVSDIEDVATFTLMVGTLRSDARIPWTKPEDVVVRGEPTPLGKEGFFGAAYESEKMKGPYALFIRADGGLAGISESIAAPVFQALTTIAGGEPVDLSKTPGALLLALPRAAGNGDARSSAQAAAGRPMTIVIFEDSDATRARASR